MPPFSFACNNCCTKKRTFDGNDNVGNVGSDGSDGSEGKPDEPSDNPGRVGSVGNVGVVVELPLDEAVVGFNTVSCNVGLTINKLFNVPSKLLVSPPQQLFQHAWICTGVDDAVSHAVTQVVQLAEGYVATKGMVDDDAADDDEEELLAALLLLVEKISIAAVVFNVLIGIAIWVLLNTYKNHGDSVTAPA